MCKTAVVLAGGKGTRLFPFTAAIPKPLVPLGETPILEIIVKQLASYGFGRVVLAVNHYARIIEAYFEDGARFGLSIEYSLEESALGTMGPLKLIADLPENFLVLNGDVLTDLDFREFLAEHIRRSSIFTVSSKLLTSTIEYGVLDVSKSSLLTGFREKPTYDHRVSMGVYAVNKSVLTHIKENQNSGFDRLMDELLVRKINVNIHQHQGFWLDIGRPLDYEQAIKVFSEQPGKFIKGGHG